MRIMHVHSLSILYYKCVKVYIIHPEHKPRDGSTDRKGFGCYSGAFLTQAKIPG